MLALQYPGRWKLAGLVLPVFVLAMALAPAFWSWPSSARPGLIELDKVGHGLTFAFLALWYTGQYARNQYFRIALALAAYGALIELLQSFLPYRSAEFADFVADAIGILGGIVMAQWFAGGWSIRAENWLGSRIG
jgi:VanZ family protein